MKSFIFFAQVYLTFNEVNFEFTEGKGKRVKSLPVRFISVYGPKHVYKKCPHFGPLQYLIHCACAHMNELKNDADDGSYRWQSWGFANSLNMILKG